MQTLDALSDPVVNIVEDVNKKAMLSVDLQYLQLILDQVLISVKFLQCQNTYVKT